MNKHFYFLVLLIIATGLSYGQANTTLSNLTTPTAVNQNLIPNSNNTRNLGTASKSWKALYLDNNLYLKDSLFMHNTGTQNTFVGLQAGNSITTGFNNTAGGYKSLYSNTTGNYNTAYGRWSLYSNTTGVQNTAYGETSLYSNTTGYVNVALGQAALYHNIDGFFNAGLGFETLFYNTSGNNNTASGPYAMFNNTTGAYNTASGTYALSNNTSGLYNTASGYYSLFSNIIGEQNTAAGCFSLYYNTGGYNVASGYKAGRSNTTGNNNVFIGWQAGYHNTDGSNNVYLGYNADGAAHVSNTVVIGANITATQNNTIILGSNQNVGIGTVSPQYRLSVNGTIQAKELRVETGWSDYVFEKDYYLRPLENVAAYIKDNKHLPGIASAKEIQQNGLAVADMQTKMMAKIEELTLYLIQQNLQIQQLKEKVEQMKKQ